MTTQPSIAKNFIWVALIIAMAACHAEEQPRYTPAQYRHWNRTTETVFNYQVPGHRDQFRIIYINPQGESPRVSEENGTIVHEYPEGTIIVKELYSGLETPEAGEEPDSLSLMIKAPHHPRARAGWLWIATSFASKEERIIDYEFCVDCHTNANEPHPYGDQNRNGAFRDFVFFPPASLAP